MSLGPTDIEQIDAVLSAGTEAPGVVTALRKVFPAMTITQCDASDVDTETPFRMWSRFSLFLVDGANHCWQLTTDAARATGLVIVANKAGS